MQARTGADAAGEWTWVPLPRPPLVQRAEGWQEEGLARRVRLEPAQASVLLMVQWQEPLHVVDRDGARTVGSFVAGPGTAPTSTSAEGPAAGVHVEMPAPVAAVLLRRDVAELRERVVDVDHLGAAWLRATAATVAGAGSWEERARRLQSALRHRLAEVDVTAQDRALLTAWRALAAGRCRGASDAAALVGWSRQHLSSTLARRAGLAPAELVRVSRLHRVLPALRTASTGSVGRLAAEAGYADHSHLVRDCRALAGAVPTALRANRSS